MLSWADRAALHSQSPPCSLMCLLHVAAFRKLSLDSMSKRDSAASWKWCLDTIPASPNEANRLSRQLGKP